MSRFMGSKGASIVALCFVVVAACSEEAEPIASTTTAEPIVDLSGALAAAREDVVGLTQLADGLFNQNGQLQEQVAELTDQVAALDEAKTEAETEQAALLALFADQLEELVLELEASIVTAVCEELDAGASAEEIAGVIDQVITLSGESAPNVTVFVDVRRIEIAVAECV